MPRVPAVAQRHMTKINFVVCATTGLLMGQSWTPVAGVRVCGYPRVEQVIRQPGLDWPTSRGLITSDQTQELWLKLYEQGGGSELGCRSVGWIVSVAVTLQFPTQQCWKKEEKKSCRSWYTLELALHWLGPHLEYLLVWWWRCGSPVILGRAIQRYPITPVASTPVPTVCAWSPNQTTGSRLICDFGYHRLLMVGVGVIRHKK